MIHRRNVAFLCTLIFGIFLFASSAFAATLQKPPNNLGLVGYWPMNEGTSTQAGDFSGRGNTGTLTNMANPPTATSGWGNGKLGGGLNFDGGNDYIDVSGIAGASSPIASGEFTLSAWFKRSTVYNSSASNGNYLFDFADAASTNDIWLFFNTMPSEGTDGALCLMVYHSTFYSSCTTQTSWNAGEWHHVVATYSGSTGSKLYVDGVQVGSNGHVGRGTTKTVEALIGEQAGNTDLFPGTIDELRVYNRALSVAEIANLYQSGSAKINTSQNNKVTNGLVGLWSFDGADMSGTTAYNRGTASGANGTLTGGPTRAIGKVGQGMSFDGVNDYVDVPYANLDFERTDPFSFSVWAKWEDSVPAGGAHAFIGRYTSPRGVIFAQCKNTLATICNANSVFFTLDSGALNGLDVMTAAQSFPPNVWTHVVVTYDGSSSPGGIKIYKNGVSMPLTTGYNNLTATIKPNINWRIGDDYTNDWMKGNMDDVRIYNRTLTQAEITQLYNMGGSKLNAPQNNIPGSTLQSGLVGLWSFNGPDMSGDTAYDRSTSGNNGTLTNGPVRAIGKVGQGLSFDGSNDYVDVPYTNLDFERTDPHSFSFWANWTSGGASNLRNFIGRYAGTKGELVYSYKTTVAYANAQAVTWYLQAAGSNILAVSSPINSITYNKWTHVVVTYDGSVAPSGVKIYLDGVSQTLTTHYNSLTATTKQNLNWQIGNDQTSDPLQGPLDDVRIYNRALIQAEVTQLYLLGK